MTIQEASDRYQIPMNILKEYESWGLCGAVKKVMGAWQYKDGERERLRMLNRKRESTLDELHFRERQLQRLDYLRHEIQKTQNRKE